MYKSNKNKQIERDIKVEYDKLMKWRKKNQILMKFFLTYFMEMCERSNDRDGKILLRYELVISVELLI